MSKDIQYDGEALKKQCELLKEENACQKRQIEQYKERIAQLKHQLDLKHRNYQEKEIIVEKRPKGRPSVSAAQKLQVKKLRQKGCTVRQIAENTGLSTGCISGILREQPEHVHKMEYMNGDELCTAVYADFTK